MSPQAPAPTLTRHDVDAPRAVALLLHGGTQWSTRGVDGRSASWRRMAVLQRTLSRSVRRDGVATWLVRYRARGWNGGAPVADASWALAEVGRRLGEVPVVLVGHSMGGRTALHVADHPSVAGVVALAPWVERNTPVHTLAGRRLVAAHARRDRITSFRATAQYVARARAAGVEAELVDMGMRGHYLLSGIREWDRVVRDGVRTIADIAR